MAPNTSTTQASCDNTGAGGAPACPSSPTPLTAHETGSERGTTVDAKVSTLANAQGLRVDWSVSEHPDGSGPASLVAAALTSTATFGSTFFQTFGSAQNAIEFSAYHVKWGGTGTVLQDCSLEVTVEGRPPVAIPTDDTRTLVSYDATSAPNGALPVEYDLECAIELPEDCDDVPAGSDCNLVGPPFDVAGHFAVEISAPSQTCRSDSMCDASVPFCVGGICRDGQEDTRCSNALDCDEGLFCGDATGRCSDGGPGDACDSDLDCPNAAGCALLSCVAGNEGDYCDADGDCSENAPFCVQPAGQFIGFCWRGALGSSCADASDCGTGLDCLGPFFNPTCVQCATNADCASGSLCLGGVCTLDTPEACTTSASCTSPEVCQIPAFGQPQVCQLDCYATNPCTGAGELCAGDRCLECLSDTDCGPGRTCVDELCEPF